jgi:hypothetical protein
MSRFTRIGRAIDSLFELTIERRLIGRAADAPAPGRPLTYIASPFPPTAAEYLKAAAGPPVWSVRLARIEALLLELNERLAADLAAWRARLPGAGEPLAAAWRGHLAALDLTPLNQLIA